VIQIANMITLQGESQPRVRNVFTLGTCAHIAGSQVLSFSNERDMLRAWREFIVKVVASPSIHKEDSFLKKVLFIWCFEHFSPVGP